MNLILIVEDNEKNLKLVRDVLQFKGYRTLEAMTATEGLRLAREERPDLVLMDIQLPDIDGITALGRLRADPLTRKTPVVAVSASVMPDDQQRIVASGFDAYVTKPINVKGFLETVERFIGKPKAD
ncbi:MAG: histidine kinase [Betaproteobacteria bacterium RIFCSPLOWO2_12_FULL_62_58]|nr:MAG: histidine kinase [Betaproteobacteria bacterium RIFCSPLOWO2_12_FULL_62_58]